MLDAKQHQGKFGEDYVRVLASAAGLVVMQEDLDVTGVDLGFRAKGKYGRVHHPMIEAQVKTWSDPKQRGGHWQYRGLNEWQFNQLAGPDFSLPRYLFLVCVPPDAADYAVSRPDGMLLRDLGYYVSLRGERQVLEPDKKRPRPVAVPTVNVLTAAALRRLTEKPTDW